MSRKTATIVTLQIRLQVPEKSNSAEVLAEIRKLLAAPGGFFESDDLIVKLVKKETNYA